MKLALKIDQQLTEDVAQTLGLMNRHPTEYDTTMSEGGSTVIKLAAGVTDQAIPLGAVAEGKYLFIETDYEISVKLNGTDVARALRLVPRTTVVGGVRTVDVKGKLLLVTAGITSIYLTNPSLTNTAVVLVSVVGD